MNKKGLSGVVTTVLIILLALVAIGGLWVVIQNLVIEGSDQISLEKFTLSIGIESAKINYTTGLAEVKVVRNSGQGNLSEIIFIVSDPKTSETFRVPVSDFDELEKRTFILNLNEKEFMNLPEIYEISIQPVFVASSGKGLIGEISDTVGNLNQNVEVEEPEEDMTGEECVVSEDCGEGTIIAGTEKCNEDNTTILIQEKIYSCESGFCVPTRIYIPNETCQDNQICQMGECVDKLKACTPETVTLDCGEDKWVGELFCSEDKTTILQGYKSYECINEICVSTIEDKDKETCLENEECHEGECFIPLECTTHSDCELGEVCKEGECLTEESVVAGTIRSAWPYNIGEYFDSADLPTSYSLDLIDKYIVFPNSIQTGCLRIADFVLPSTQDGISYVRLNQSPTNIQDSDSFQIWETDYICSIY
jgi:hypothetical protein